MTDLLPDSLEQEGVARAEALFTQLQGYRNSFSTPDAAAACLSECDAWRRAFPGFDPIEPSASSSAYVHEDLLDDLSFDLEVERRESAKLREALHQEGRIREAIKKYLAIASPEDRGLPVVQSMVQLLIDVPEGRL